MPTDSLHSYNSLIDPLSYGKTLRGNKAARDEAWGRAIAPKPEVVETGLLWETPVVSTDPLVDAVRAHLKRASLTQLAMSLNMGFGVSYVNQFLLGRTNSPGKRAHIREYLANFDYNLRGSQLLPGTDQESVSDSVSPPVQADAPEQPETLREDFERLKSSVRELTDQTLRMRQEHDQEVAKMAQELLSLSERLAGAPHQEPGYVKGRVHQLEKRMAVVVRAGTIQRKTVQNLTEEVLRMGVGEGDMAVVLADALVHLKDLTSQVQGLGTDLRGNVAVTQGLVTKLRSMEKALDTLMQSRLLPETSLADGSTPTELPGARLSASKASWFERLIWRFSRVK